MDNKALSQCLPPHAWSIFRTWDLRQWQHSRHKKKCLHISFLRAAVIFYDHRCFNKLNNISKRQFACHFAAGSPQFPHWGSVKDLIYSILFYSITIYLWQYNHTACRCSRQLLKYTVISIVCLWTFDLSVMHPWPRSKWSYCMFSDCLINLSPTTTQIMINV